MRPASYIATLAICLAACAAPSQLTNDEAASVRALARARVVASGILNGEREAQLIASTEPKMSYYFLARPLGDYAIEWHTATEERIVVHGRGDILKLEGASVQRLPKHGT